MRYVRRGWYEVCGVYLLINTINNKRYVGSSVNVGGRVNQHFQKGVVDRYKHTNELYKDIDLYGRDSFKEVLLEKCTKEEKLERERYWYFALSPEYNMVIPDENPLIHPVVVKKAKLASQTEQSKERRISSHRTAAYRNYCRESKRNKMVRCIGRSPQGDTPIFESMSDAAKWLKRPSRKTCVISHIGDSIHSSTRRAYGYKWEVMT